MGDAPDLGGLSEDDEQQGVPATDVSKPEILFDSKTMDLVVDFRAVCSLPHDPDVDGVKTLRAITFGKGKGVHAPKEPGKIFVCGPWKLLHVMCKVYFLPNTHRVPELLIGFVDFGFVNPTMHGVSVETLALPLMIKKGVYQDAVRLTKIEDVAGFTPINAGLAPWSMNLKPALAKQAIFKALKIFTPADVNKWLSSQRMEKRIESLTKYTQEAMTAAVAEIKRQDPTQASKTRALFEAKFKNILAAIAKLPPSAYDVTMAKRMIELVEDRDKETDPVWLTSPIHKDMREGKVEFIRTRLHAAPPPVTTNTAPIEEPVRQPAFEEATPAAAATGMADDEELELSEDSENNSDVVEVEPRESARSKRAPDRFKEPDRAPPKQKKGAAAAKAPAPAAAKLNPKTGTDWVRGPYQKTSASAARTLAKAEKDRLKKELASSASHVEVASLKLQLKAALEARKAAEDMLVQSQRMVTLEVDKARAEGEKNGLLAASEEYKKGVAAGAAIASGKSFSFASESPAQSYSGRSGQSSNNSQSFGGFP